MPDKKPLVIIGGGPAGLTAALYACRARIPSVLLEKTGQGGQVLLTDWVDNYPGFPDGISGFDLVDRMTAQARRFGMEETNEEVVSLTPSTGQDKGVKLTLADDKTIDASAVIVATGASHNKLGIPGETELSGKGVSYCATCDGAFYRNVPVAVAGGGDTAVQEAIFLTRFASKVYIVHRRDELRAVKILQEEAFANPKIEVIWDSVVEKVNGEDGVKSVTIFNKKSGKRSELPVEGLFVFIGIHPETSFLKGTVELDPSGFIITDDWMRTSQPLIYAAGDCRSKPLLQIVTAVSDGATAVFAAEHDIMMAGT